MIIDWMFEPAQFFLDPAKRVYWLYLLSALVVASLAVTYQEGRFQPMEQLRSLVNPRYWFSKSSLYDLFLMIFNLSLIHI